MADTTLPRSNPVSLEQLRLWCRLDQAEDDATVDALLLAAWEVAQSYTGQTFDSPEATPQAVKHAIAVMVNDWYTNREGEFRSTTSVQYLLNPYRKTLL